MARDHNSRDVATDAMVYNAVEQQMRMLGTHVGRLHERAERYDVNSMQYALAMVEVAAATEKYDLVVALHNGLTVQPT